MPVSEHDYHAEIKALLLENQRLLKENNDLLKVMQRNARVALVIKVVAYALFIGAPLIMYYYLIEPNIAPLRDAYSTLGGNQSGITDTLELLKSLQP